MVRRNNWMGLVGGAMMAIAAAGCGTGMNNPDGSSGNDVQGDTQQGMPETLTYVLRTLTVDTDNSMPPMISDSPDIAHTGFNIDGLFSGMLDANGCTHEDFFSSIDLDQNNMGMRCTMSGQMPPCGGVDNQLPTLAGSIAGIMPDLNINASIAEQINTGQLSLIMQVSDVNDRMNDSAVTVRLALGYPTFADCGMLFTGGQYVVSQSSLRANGTSINDASFSFPGAIVNGRVQVTTPADATFELPLPEIMGVSLRLNLRTPRMRVSPAATGNAQAGNLGGYVAGGELVDTVVRAFPQFETAARMIIGGLVDHQINGVCVDGSGPTARYGGVSLGLGFTIAPATLSTMAPAANRLPNTCGSMGGGG